MTCPRQPPGGAEQRDRVLQPDRCRRRRRGERSRPSPRPARPLGAGRLDGRLGHRSFGLHSRTASEGPRSEGRPPISGVVVCLETDRSLGLTLSLPLARPRIEGPGRFEDHDEQRATPRRRRGSATARWTAPRRWRPPRWAGHQGPARHGYAWSWPCLVKRPRGRRCRSALHAPRGFARLSQPPTPRGARRRAADRGRPKDRPRRVMNRAAWADDPPATKEVGTVSEVPETPPTSFVIVELARPPRQVFRFAEQAD